MRFKSTISVILVLLSAPAWTHAAPTETNSPAATDWSYFQIIPERNIFNPSRSGRVKYSKGQSEAKADSCALVGTLSYEKGRFAFFNGSGSEFRKVLKLNDAFIGYTLSEIGSNYVKLAGTNGAPVELRVGMQLRREGNSAWALSGPATSYASSGDSAAKSAEPVADKTESSSSGAENEILKKLKQKREQELKDK